MNLLILILVLVRERQHIERCLRQVLTLHVKFSLKT